MEVTFLLFCAPKDARVVDGVVGADNCEVSTSKRHAKEKGALDILSHHPQTHSEYTSLNLSRYVLLLHSNASVSRSSSILSLWSMNLASLVPVVAELKVLNL